MLNPYLKKQEDFFKTDHERKQEISLVKERKRLNLLEELKVYSGPFTNSDEVDNFLNDSIMNDKEKEKLMKQKRFNMPGIALQISQKSVHYSRFGKL